MPETTAAPETEGTGEIVSPAAGCQAFVATGAAVMTVLVSVSAYALRRRDD